MIHLVIDGYNLIKNHIIYERLELEKARERLVEDLTSYKVVKGHSISVVFDGWKGGESFESKEMIKGIEVIFSRRGERADEVIKRIAETERERAVIVSLDRELINFCERVGCATISPSQFERRMKMAFSYPIEEERVFLKKRGSARKLPKTKRKSLLRLKKL